MSSGVVAVPGVGLVLIVPLAGAAIVAGAAVVLAARAAAAGTEAVTRALVRSGKQLECEENRYFEAQREADLWQLAVAEVVDRNARIAALTSLARSVGEPGGPQDAPIPPPLDLAGKCLTEVQAWCARVDSEIVQARRELGRRAASAARRQIAASLPAAQVKLMPVIDLLAQHRAALTAAASAAKRTPAQATRGSSATDPARAKAAVAERVDQQLASLDPEARPEDRAQALQAAAQALDATPQVGRSHVTQLTSIVQRANQRVSDTRTAARYLQAARMDAVHEELADDDRAVLRELDAVVAGERDLDEALTSRAHLVLGQVEAAGARRYLRDQVKQIMEAQGYQMDGEFTTLRPGVDGMTLSGAGWDEHHLRIVIDNGRISYLTQRDHEVRGDAAARLDEERCDQVAVTMQQLAETLRSRGTEQVEFESRREPSVIYLAPSPAAELPRQAPAPLAMPQPREEQQ